MDRLYRSDPSAALKKLDELQKVEPSDERLLALARLCGALGDEVAETDPEFAAGCYLDAARLSFDHALQMSPSGAARDLRLIYNDSCADLACLLQSRRRVRKLHATFKGPIGVHHLNLRTTGAGTIRPGSFDELYAADRIELKHAELERRYNDGIGGVVIGRRPKDQIDDLETRFVPDFGLILHLNATVGFSETGNRAEMIVSDLSRTGSVQVGGRSAPLAGEWTAALAYLYQYAPTPEDGFLGMLRPAKEEGETDLYELTPYQADKIPLIFVHGLMSSPDTWITMIAVLGSDPVLRQNYQPLVFQYPTGYPIIRNAAELRSHLAAYRAMAKARGGGAALDRMVMIGHSMGGILTNIQIRKSGDRVRNMYLNTPIEDLDVGEAQQEKLRRLMVFDYDPSIRRAIFIAAPHRGSDLARNSLGRFGSWLIRLPGDILSTGLSITQLDRLPGLTEFSKNQLTSRPDSIKSLRPDSQFLAKVLELPVNPRVDYHTIAGQADPSDSIADSSDKVVPYWSSHLDDVASERMVAASHVTITGNDDAIEEVRRLLYLHLGKQLPQTAQEEELPEVKPKTRIQLGRPVGR
ncbi:hypothetical protein HAHE_35610 [Haloferula helveola]|uniref:AB hydrolase-1 domain-containing protein n=1 Tax=Haloferula helveola TaxID=490095 RepID=A0ABM7RH67_9BACT|nr:hypothetical protein HAHE_35610 [Haloferula helveola]